jgi:hypothetical protein
MLAEPGREGLHPFRDGDAGEDATKLASPGIDDIEARGPTFGPAASAWAKGLPASA